MLSYYPMTLHIKFSILFCSPCKDLSSSKFLIHLFQLSQNVRTCSRKTFWLHSTKLTKCFPNLLNLWIDFQRSMYNGGKNFLAEWLLMVSEFPFPNFYGYFSFQVLSSLQVAVKQIPPKIKRYFKPSSHQQLLRCAMGAFTMLVLYRLQLSTGYLQVIF